MNVLKWSAMLFALSTVLGAQGQPNLDWPRIETETMQHYQAPLR
jgi:hypothetical protein